LTRTRIDFDQAEDLEFASQYELDGVKDNNRVPVQFVQSTMNNYDLWLKVVEALSRTGDSNFTYFNPSANKDYVEIGDTTYVVVSSFIFRGTNIWTPGTAYMVLSRSKTAGTSYVRLYDVTHNLQVFEFTYAADAKQIHTYTSFSNLPTGLSVFEVQLKTSSGSAGSVRLHAMGLYP
jgi:hypothetical protein